MIIQIEVLFIDFQQATSSTNVLKANEDPIIAHVDNIAVAAKNRRTKKQLEVLFIDFHKHLARSKDQMLK